MRKNKRGTSTLFLAIILTALILVETTYIAYVADLDRRLTYTRALKEQTEIYLASYNRQLFKTYGIYAFDSTRLDPYVFDQILAANGYEVGDVIYASGIYTLDTETLRRSVAAYYSYRTSGVLFQRFSAQIMSLLGQFGNGVTDAIREFISSPASGVVGRIINGGSDIAEAIVIAMNTLGLDESSPVVQKLYEIMGTILCFTNYAPDFSNYFDPTDLSFFFDLIGFNASIFDIGTELNETINSHWCLADYAGNNFDCYLEEDTAIDGTSFSAFHSENEYDSEFILTGLEGMPACALTDYYIYCCLFLRNFVMNYTDPSKAEIIEGIADVLSVAVSALTAGTVSLPPSVYQVVIVALMSEAEAIVDLGTILGGGEIEFVSIGSVEALTLDYRNFLSVFMNLVPDDLLLERMLTVFDRDFPGYAIGIDTETDYRGSTMHYEGRYEYYG